MTAETLKPGWKVPIITHLSTHPLHTHAHTHTHTHPSSQLSTLTLHTHYIHTYAHTPERTPIYTHLYTYTPIYPYTRSPFRGPLHSPQHPVSSTSPTQCPRSHLWLVYSPALFCVSAADFGVFPTALQGQEEMATEATGAPHLSTPSPIQSR